MIDTHCHFDMMSNPESYIQRMANEGHTVIGMTNCPEHFLAGINFVKSYSRIRLALGFHPLVVPEIYNQLGLFDQLENQTSYIGEVGLDFYRCSQKSKDIQIQVFSHICELIKGKRKIVSIHSRKAEYEVLNILEQNNVTTPILHWYTGPVDLIDRAIALGCYFSINESMTCSNGGRLIISQIPQDRILTETDAPYNRKSDIRNALMNMSISPDTVERNFRTLLKTLQT